jgi:DMSO/TMAO reductase YedYZ heme-binding membrane subunit
MMIAASSSQLLWYTTRATGVVALVVLTASVVLGIATSVRWATNRWPRFAFQDLHRRISLLAVVFVALHVVTTVSDSFAPIGWISVFVPFTSSYRRLWLGLGTVAVDLLLAVALSSVFRRWIAPRAWRMLHWLAYACWPLAVVHAFGTGTDPHLRWMLVVLIACVAAVLGAVGWRLAVGWPDRAGARVTAAVAAVAALIALGAWAISGPLRPGWPARAGTPRSLLASRRPATAATPGSATAESPTRTSSPNALPAPPYQASLTGTLSRGTSSGGLQVDIRATTGAPLDAALAVTLRCSSDGTGGVMLEQSTATFGTTASPTQYRGHVTTLDGTHLVLALADARSSPLDLRVDLFSSGGRLTGELRSLARGIGQRGGNDDD